MSSHFYTTTRRKLNRGDRIIKAWQDIPIRTNFSKGYCVFLHSQKGWRYKSDGGSFSREFESLPGYVFSHSFFSPVNVIRSFEEQTWVEKKGREKVSAILYAGTSSRQFLSRKNLFNLVFCPRTLKILSTVILLERSKFTSRIYAT